MKTNCPKCNRVLTPSLGDEGSPSALVLDYPIGYMEHVVAALNTEFGKMGIQLSQMHIVYYWKHAKTDECDESWHTQSCLKELQNARSIMMMGTDCCNAFLGSSGSEISGIISKSKFLPKALIVPSPTPIGLTKGPVGEYRLALQKFVDLRRKKYK